MNILTNYPNVSLVTTNPATDSVVRDNAVRPIVPPAAPLPSSNASPNVATEREKAQPPQVAPLNNPTYDAPPNQAQEDVEQAQRDGQQQEESQGEQQQSAEQENAKDESTERYTEQELKEISELKQRNREVVAHEQAHAAVGGKYAGTPSYSYERGPDGAKYAVSGEVSIDTSRIPNDPHGTLIKAQQIKRAALAPAMPSSQDRRVAVKAEQMATQARQDIMAEFSGEIPEKSYRVDGEVKSDSFSSRIELAQNSKFQQTIKNRTLHINQYYQTSSHVATEPSINQQV